MKTRTALSAGDGISVIIPAKGPGSGLERTLLSFYRQLPEGLKTQVLVANDGADPRVTSACRNHGVVMVAIRPHRGSYYARNRALERAEGDRIFFLDAGIEVPCGWLAQALTRIGTADYLACEVDISCAPRPTAAQAYEMKHSYPIFEYMRSQHYGVTAGLGVSRRLLQAVGDFDQRLQSGGDFEFGNRVYAAGIEQAYMAAPVLLHPPRRALGFLRKQFRVNIGYGRLTRIHPRRFPRKRIPACLWTLLRSLLPPHMKYVRSEFPVDTGVAAWRRFFFLWILKICRATAGFIAMLVPTPPAHRPPAHIEWSDFSRAGKP